MIKKLLTDLKEVRAYRDLSGVPFDFGAGIIDNISTGSEDAHYEMQEQDIIDRMDDLMYCDVIHLSCVECPIYESCDDGYNCHFHLDSEMDIDEIEGMIERVEERSRDMMEKWRTEDEREETLMRKEKSRGNTSHVRKREDKRRLKYMVNEQYDEESDSYYHKRYYLSGRKVFAKKVSNKKVRKYRPYVSLKGADYRKVYDYWWTVY